MQPRHSKVDFGARGDAIYEREVEPQLTSEEVGKFVAIDVESGAYGIGPDELTASDRLLARRPEAQVWLRRAGSRYAHRFRPRAREIFRVIRGTVSALREALITLTVRGPAPVTTSVRMHEACVVRCVVCYSSSTGHRDQERAEVVR